jgi:hypothetical protein
VFNLPSPADSFFTTHQFISTKTNAMKRIIFLITVLGFFVSSCNQNKTTDQETPGSLKDTAKTQADSINWTSYTGISEGDAQLMADHYADLVKRDPSIGIQQINMAGALLEALMDRTEGLKLIAAADLKTNAITVIMQFWRSGQFSYYNINSFFNSSQPGMRGKPPICPPPAGCDLPLMKSINPNLISEEDAQQMADHYIDIVKSSPGMSIQQVNMDGSLLGALLYRTEGFRLIAAADLRTNVITMLMQFWRGGSFYYFNIKDFFTPDMKGMRGKEAVCPPPAGCDLPFIPIIDSTKIRK